MIVEGNGRRDAPEKLLAGSPQCPRVTSHRNFAAVPAQQRRGWPYTGALVSHPHLISNSVSPTFPSSVLSWYKTATAAWQDKWMDWVSEIMHTLYPAVHHTIP